MKEFYEEKLYLTTAAAEEIYREIENLPVLDYHCHLNEREIARNAPVGNLGRLWLAGDHYKWRAMRLCGVDETYITGEADEREKFLKYAEILPKLAGNAVYEWTHLELRRIFGIREPLDADSAPRIWERAEKTAKTLTPQDLLKKFGVEYVATTDDPVSDLSAHGVYGATRVSPTFRPDKLYYPDEEYLARLGAAAGVNISALCDLHEALSRRLDYFQSKGCKISDHGFERFPRFYADERRAEELFLRRGNWTEEEKEAFFGYLLVWLAREYGKRGMIMQMHFSVIRNCNERLYARCGADAGFDLIGGAQNGKDLVNFFNRLSDEERPETVVYTLNDSNLRELIAVTGAFRRVRGGAAWWFNDTKSGILRNLRTLGEYGALGVNFGMLTDSRSFSSYVRFEYFRRLLARHLGELVEGGEFPLSAAKRLAANVSYHNVKEALGL